MEVVGGERRRWGSSRGEGTSSYTELVEVRLLDWVGFMLAIVVGGFADEMQAESANLVKLGNLVFTVSFSVATFISQGVQHRESGDIGDTLGKR